MGAVVVSPEAHRLVAESAPSAMKTLEGVTLGLLCNGKPNAQVLLDTVAAGIAERVALAGVVRDRKPSPTSAAPEEVYANLAARCGAVIFASAT